MAVRFCILKQKILNSLNIKQYNQNASSRFQIISFRNDKIFIIFPWYSPDSSNFYKHRVTEGSADFGLHNTHVLPV